MSVHILFLQDLKLKSWVDLTCQNQVHLEDRFLEVIERMEQFRASGLCTLELRYKCFGS